MFGKGSGSRLSPTDLTYVNLDKAPMTGTSITDLLNMRKLTRFLWLGIARLMGKNTPKRDKTISYQSLRYRTRPDAKFRSEDASLGLMCSKQFKRLIEQSRCLF